MYEELLKKLPATFLDRERIAKFAVLMEGRTKKGKKEYSEDFKFDPLDEAKEELVDAAVYCMILWHRIEKIQERIRGLESKKS